MIRISERKRVPPTMPRRATRDASSTAFLRAWLLVTVAVTGCGRGPGPAAPAAQPAAAILVRGLGAEPGTLDPFKAEDNAALTVTADLYEGLAREAASGAIEPGSAQSWHVSADGLEVVFNLRPGLRWSDDTALTASHFAASLRELTSAGSTAPYAGLFAGVRRVEVIDDRRLRLRLDGPMPHLPALLAMPAAAPHHPGSPHDGLPPTNGPFKLASRSIGDRIELQRNPNYWDAAAVALERVTYRPLADLATELNLYRTGELDITSEVPNTQFNRLRHERPDELKVTPYLSTYSYVVNMQRLPDPVVRRALAMAVDRVRLTEKVTGAGETPAYGWVPDGIAGYEPARFAWQREPRADAERRARESWQSARLRNAVPSTIKLCTDASENHRRTAVALADFWRSTLGVEVIIEELEWTVYLDRRRSPGDCDLIRLGWSADFIDPEAFAQVFQSTHPQNTLGYRNGRYDELVARSRSTASPQARLDLLRTAEAQLLEDVPVIPIFFRVSKRLVKPYVRGVQPNPLGHLASRHLSVLAH